MGLADVTLMAFTVRNSIRVLAYLPQIWKAATDDNGAVLACPPSGFFTNDRKNLIMNTSTSRIGTFTQVGLGTATVFGSSGWVAYGRADYRNGENVEGYSVNAGVRYHW